MMEIWVHHQPWRASLPTGTALWQTLGHNREKLMLPLKPGTCLLQLIEALSCWTARSLKETLCSLNFYFRMPALCLLFSATHILTRAGKLLQDLPSGRALATALTNHHLPPLLAFPLVPNKDLSLSSFVQSLLEFKSYPHFLIYKRLQTPEYLSSSLICFPFPLPFIL